MSVAFKNFTSYTSAPIALIEPPPDQTISVVIPSKNEARNLPWVLERLPKYIDEVILVDGLSTDGTVEVAKHVRPDTLVVYERRLGKGHAVKAGLRAASGDIIVMLDADGSMDPGEIGRYVDALSWGFDLAKGSRFLPGGGTSDMTMLRKFGNWGLTQLSNGLYGTTFTDLCYGYVAFRRSAVERIPISAEGFEIEMQLLARSVRNGLRIVEVPSYESDRMFGQSSLNTFRDGWRVLKTLLRERIRTAATPKGSVHRV